MSILYVVQQRNTDYTQEWEDLVSNRDREVVQIVYNHWKNVNHSHSVQYRLVKLEVLEQELD